MTSRPLRALFRREVMRGRRGLVLTSLLASVAIVLAAVLSGDAAMVPAALAVLAGILVTFTPLGDLRDDKTLGHLEFDRVLPISHRRIAAARLLGAAVRTLPILLFALPLTIAVCRRSGAGLESLLPIAALVVAGAWLVLTTAMWGLMGINARWNLRGLWWLPMTVVFGPRLVLSALPVHVTDRFAAIASHAGAAILTFVASRAGGVAIGLAAVAIAFTVFLVAVSLFASGLERYNYDAAAGMPRQAAAPRRELGAIGRGALLAVARYCLRLATEQSRRRLILLAVFVAVLVLGSPIFKDYARFYVRALAALIPGGIALQLGTARARGYLEGMQQLPHPAVTVGAGHLLAIAILAVPGVAVWVLARAVTGVPPTANNVLSLFGWLVMGSWLAGVAAIWLTVPRMLMIVSIPAAALAAWAVYAGFGPWIHGIAAAAAHLRDFQARAGAALPLTLCCALMLAGLPIFARGLSEYEPRASAAANRWPWRARP